MTTKKAQWVLILEDEPDLRDTLIAKLEKEGYRVMACSTVAEAMKLCLNQKFGLIVLDYQLENGTSEQLLTNIRKSPSNLNHTVPVLLISAHLNIDLFKSVGKKINAALVKPFARDVFAAKVREMCPPPKVGEPDTGEGLSER
jgi:DNA-binding response OmpR family regulator